MMLKPPERKWKDRYYQGTDPIGNETGISYMASFIMDNAYKHSEDSPMRKRPVCMIYHRKQYNPKETFLQCLLMGLYYDTNNGYNAKRGVPELIENNIGMNYMEYQRQKGFYGRLVMNTQLPEVELRGGGAMWGINTSGSGKNRRKHYCVAKVREYLYSYIDEIFFEIVFKELETYVNIQKADENWQPLDKKNYRDDAIDALAFTYICCLCFKHKTPTKREESNEKKRRVVRLIRDANNNLTPSYVTVVQN